MCFTSASPSEAPCRPWTLNEWMWHKSASMQLPQDKRLMSSKDQEHTSPRDPSPGNFSGLWGVGCSSLGREQQLRSLPSDLELGFKILKGTLVLTSWLLREKNLSTIATQGKAKFSNRPPRAHTSSCSPTRTQVLAGICFCTSEHGPQYFPMEPEAYQFSTGLPTSTQSSVLCVSAMSTQPGVFHHICVCTLAQDCTQQQRNRPCVLGTFSGADNRAPCWRKLPQKSFLLSSLPSQQETDMQV